MSEITFLDPPDRPKPTRRLTIGAFMVVVVPLALILALVRGHELAGGLIAAWGGTLVAAVETLTRRTGRSRVRAGLMVCRAYPWVASVLVGFLQAYGAIRPRPLGAEFAAALALVILVGVPVALVVNYYLVLLLVYPVGPAGEPAPVAPAEVRPLVMASVTSWVTGLIALVLILLA